MSQLTKLLQQSETLHSHLCPRQVLGVRMGMLAVGLLDLELPQTEKRLHTFIETDGCLVDGVSVATGCTLGHRTLHYLDYGRVAATFVDATTHQAIRIHPHPEARATANAYQPDAQSHWHAMLDAYQVMTNAELFCWQPVKLTLDLTKLISRHGVRATCSVCGEEILNEREVIVDGQPVCRACAGETYYQAQAEMVTFTHK